MFRPLCVPLLLLSCAPQEELAPRPDLDFSCADTTPDCIEFMLIATEYDGENLFLPVCLRWDETQYDFENTWMEKADPSVCRDV